MVRLILCLIMASATACGLLLLRQQRLQLRHECNVLHGRILDTQRVLWRQQVRVAGATGPAALDQVLQRQEEARLQTEARLAAQADAAGEWHDLPDRLASDGDDWSSFAN